MNSNKQDYIKEIEERIGNIEYIVPYIIQSLINEKLGFWEIISKAKPKEHFPEPTEEQVDEVIQCCLRAFHHYTSYQDKISHAFYNIIKSHYLNNGNKRLATSIIVVILFDYLPMSNISEKSNLLKRLSLGIAAEEGNDKKMIGLKKLKKSCFRKRSR